MTEETKTPNLRFEEGIKQFHKGVVYFEEFAVDMYLDEEHIGHICANGKITISGYATEKNPSTIIPYSNTFPFEQWMEIGARTAKFVGKCGEREAKCGPAFKKLEELARKMFPEDGAFGHVEIAKIGHDHLVLGGGKGEWSTYAPGIYAYNSALYGGGEAVKVGYRPVEEQRVAGVNNLGDEMLFELVKAADSVGDPTYAEACEALEKERQPPPGTPSFNADTYSLPCEKDPDTEV